LAILLPLALAGVALAAGLAAVAAVRLFGITFLALPRTAGAESAVEATPLMRTAMAVPAVACLFLGLAPTLVLPAIGAVTAGLHLPSEAIGTGSLALSLPLVGSRYWPAGLALVLTTAALAVSFAVGRRTARQPVRVDSAWNCGRLTQSARSEYTAASFAEPLKRVFTGFYRPAQEVTVDVHPISPYFVRSIQVRDSLAPWIEQAIYTPLVQAVRWASLRTRRLHAGSIHAYLALLPAALLALLLVARWLP
jgi:hypothetical protein